MKTRQDKEKEIALNDFGGLATPKKGDISIINQNPPLETMINLEIYDKYVDILIGKLIIYDISFKIREHPEYKAPGNINLNFWTNEYYGFCVDLEEKIWHLIYIPSGYHNLKINEYPFVNAGFPLVKFNEEQYLIRINNYPFIDSLKEKFQIQTPLILPKVRFVSWGKYKSNPEKQEYTLSIKFYDSLMEQRNDDK